MLNVLSKEDAINIVTEAGYTKPLNSVLITDKGSLLSNIPSFYQVQSYDGSVSGRFGALRGAFLFKEV